MSPPTGSMQSAGVPLVLRRVPDGRMALARQITGGLPERPDETWWEFVDVAADVERPPEAIVVATRAVQGQVELEALVATDDIDVAALVGLVAQLVAMIRCTGERRISARAGSRDLSAALLAAGFAPAPQDRLVLDL